MTPTDIEALLTRLGWSRIKFARWLDVDRSTISRWLSGQPMPAGTERLCRLLRAYAEGGGASAALDARALGLIRRIGEEMFSNRDGVFGAD